MRTNGTVLICSTIVTCFIITGAVILSVTGSEFTEFRATLNTVLNAVSAAFGIGGCLYAGSAARSVEQVRGQLDGGASPPPMSPDSR